MSTWSNSARWKGKQRARDEGQGGSAGIVLSLDVVMTGDYDIAYSIPILVGTDQQKFSLQVDTGSSDLWIASTSCRDSSCGQTDGHLYDPSKATQTGKTFSIQYLQGTVSGPIVWDQVQLGGYSVLNQALAAADNVASEPLTSDFDGVLGLALPLNSVIAQAITPVTGNSPDGAAFASNLFGITPASAAPSAPFISLSLSRPGSDAIPALLGIGLHPEEVISDPSRVQYSTLVREQQGVLFWKTNVMAITVYADGQAKSIDLGQSSSGGAFPTAVLDSGVPLILTTSTVANAIYGAIGIQPGANGQYYVPCNVPLNLTVTLDNRSEIPIHPLDLSTEPPSGSSSDYCIGLIQTDDAQLTDPMSNIGDMILGVPFMRNTYTVMAYAAPDGNGNFNESSRTSKGSSLGDIKPFLGLLGLTDPTVALQEFQKVRVYNQPLGPTKSATSSVPDRKMSVGIEVLIGLLSFFTLCIFLFGLRWFLLRRRWNTQNAAVPAEFGDNQKKGVYQLAPRHSLSHADQPSEDTLRTLRYERYMEKVRTERVERLNSENTSSSVPTQVGSDDGEEFGLRPSSVPAAADAEEPWDPATGLEWGDRTLVGSTGVRDSQNYDQAPEHEPDAPSPPADAEDGGPTHLRALSVSVPLLAHIPEDARHADADDDLGEFGLGGAASMAGVGTAARGSRIDPDLGHGSMGSIGSLSSMVGAGSVPRARPRQRSFHTRPPSLPLAGRILEEG